MWTNSIIMLHLVNNQFRLIIGGDPWPAVRRVWVATERKLVRRQVPKIPMKKFNDTENIFGHMNLLIIKIISLYLVLERYQDIYTRKCNKYWYRYRFYHLCIWYIVLLKCASAFLDVLLFSRAVVAQFESGCFSIKRTCISVKFYNL